MDLIPNRYPIIYIDYVDEIESGKKIIATKNVTINEDFFFSKDIFQEIQWCQERWF